jgi:hypothetical protein
MLHWARYTMDYSFDIALSREVAMACNGCETNFQGSQTLVVNVAKSGSSAVLRVANQGRNIVLIRRILLCLTNAGGGYYVYYLRAPPDPISWIPHTTYLEPESGGTFYIWKNLPTGSIVQAQAEYVEIEVRSRSCPTRI